MQNTLASHRAFYAYCLKVILTCKFRKSNDEPLSDNAYQKIDNALINAMIYIATEADDRESTINRVGNESTNKASSIIL